MKITRTQRLAPLIWLVAWLTLAACGGTDPQEATPELRSGPAVMGYPEPAEAGYPAPGAPPAAPTSVPTSVPAAPTTAPAAAGLVGPEWTIAFSGDLNRDGRPDVVAYKPAGIAPGPTFGQRSYTGYIGTATEAVIVQADDTGRPVVLVTMSPAGVAIGGMPVLSFDGARSAIMVNINTAEPALVSTLVVDAAGEPYTQAVGEIGRASCRERV